MRLLERLILKVSFRLLKSKLGERIVNYLNIVMTVTVREKAVYIRKISPTDVRTVISLVEEAKDEDFTSNPFNTPTNGVRDIRR